MKKNYTLDLTHCNSQEEMIAAIIADMNAQKQLKKKSLFQRIFGK